MIDVAEKPLSRRELNKQNRRDLIIQAARVSFLEQGYDGTSMSGLLTTLGGSKQTLWSYFRSKEELFAAVVEDITSSFRVELVNVLALSGDLENGLLNFGISFLRKIESPEALATWRLVVGESGRFPEVGRIFYERAVSMTENTLAGFLSRFVINSARNETSLQMAQTFLGLFSSRQNRLLWGVEQNSPDIIEREATSVTSLFLGLYADSLGGPTSPNPETKT